LGGRVTGRNARGLNLREQIERIRAQAPAASATPMRPSKPALPEWARPQDLAPTVENARRLGLPETTRPAANRRPSAERPANEPPALTRYLDHAGRAVNAAVNAIAEPVAMAVDLGMAGVGAAYTATTGKPADMPFISFASQDVADGATATDLLNGMNPVYGLMVTAHEIGRAISFNDTGALAEIGGGMVGSMVGPNRTPRPFTPTMRGITSLSAHNVRFSQSTISYHRIDRSTNLPYTYDDLVDNMRNYGWRGDPIDVVHMPDGILTSVDNTRLAAAREAGINIQANIHGFNDPLPDEFYLTRRFGDARTWGEAVLYRIRRQRPPVFEIDNPNGAVRRPVLNGGKNE